MTGWWSGRGPPGAGRSKYGRSDILARLMLWTIMLFVLQLAFGIFGPNPVSDLLRGLIAYLPNIFVAILILVITAAIARAVTDLLSNLLGAMQGGQLLARGAGIAIVVVAVSAPEGAAVSESVQQRAEVPLLAGPVHQAPKRLPQATSPFVVSS